MIERAEMRFKVAPGYSMTQVVSNILAGDAYVTMNDGSRWLILAETVIVDPEDGWGYCAIVPVESDPDFADA